MPQSRTRTVYVGQLQYAEKERFFDFLVHNRIAFVAEEEDKYVATIQVIPPASQAGRLGGRVSSPKGKAPAAGPGLGRSQSAEPRLSSKRAATPGGKRSTGGVQSPQSTRRQATACLRKRYQRFCNLLPPLSQPPRKLDKHGLIRFAEDLYEARYEQEVVYHANKAQGPEVEKLSRFPDFFYEFTRKRFGLMSMVCNNCWALVSSMELLRGSNTHAENFSRFVEETWEAEDLTFYLFLRTELEEELSKMPRKRATDDGDDHDVNYGKAAAAREKRNHQKNRKKICFEGHRINERICSEALKTTLKKISPENKALFNPVMARCSTVINECNRNKSEEEKDPDPGAESNLVLQTATEVYRMSRGRPEDPERDRGEELFKRILDWQQDSKEYMPEIPANLRELDSGVRKEVKQITKSLIEGLVASGKSEINQKELLDWALNIVIRRHDRGQFADANPHEVHYTLDLDEMMEETSDLHLDPNTPHFSTGHYEVVLGMDVEEFELHFEDNIRQLLLYSLEQSVGDVIDKLQGAFFDARARAGARTKIAVNLTPVADAMMEAVVSKDYRRWVRSLRAHRDKKTYKSIELRLRQAFQHLHEKFQSAVANPPVTPFKIHDLCRAIVGVEEMEGLIRKRVGQLSRDPNAELSDTDVNHDEEFDHGHDHDHDHH